MQVCEPLVVNHVMIVRVTSKNISGGSTFKYGHVIRPCRDPGEEKRNLKTHQAGKVRIMFDLRFVGMALFSAKLGYQTPAM